MAERSSSTPKQDTVVSQEDEPIEDEGFSLDTDGDGLDLDDIVNRLDAFQMIRHDKGPESDELLKDLGATSKVDRDIVLELGAKRPLGHPARFEEAHGLAVRSLEVLDRNGHRSIPVPNLSFLSPVVSFLVQIVTQFIVRSHVSSVIDHMHRLYERREAASPADWEHLPMLTRARIHTERIRPGFKRSRLALPTFLFGGAILSPLIATLQSVISNQVSSKLWRSVWLIVIFMVLSLASWVIVHGAAVARRRIRLTTEKPVNSLWQVIGRCGNPPRDSSMTFAVIALILTIVSAVVVVLGLINVLA
ncbi:MAG: hypothetical protein AAF567_13470 [Actinomycetota bacterium]